MRAPLLALLLAAPLAGCLQGDPGSTTTTFAASCPNWTVAQHPLSALVDTTLYQAKTPGQTTRTNVETFPMSAKGPATPPPDENGKKADRYTLVFPASSGGPIVVENGTLTFRAFRNDTNQQLAFADVSNPAQTKMELTFGASAKAFVGSAQALVSLVPPTQEPKPAALRLEATFTALPGYTIGTGSGGTQRAGASFSVEPLVSYRAPGCLQK